MRCDSCSIGVPGAFLNCFLRFFPGDSNQVSKHSVFCQSLGAQGFARQKNPDEMAKNHHHRQRSSAAVAENRRRCQERFGATRQWLGVLRWMRRCPSTASTWQVQQELEDAQRPDRRRVMHPQPWRASPEPRRVATSARAYYLPHSSRWLRAAARCF
ncbi:hypothetical protein BI312_11425 [Xanthomonas citri pv. citri]|uniref:Uncharacterized protein n=1 Tax=Xanthomonas axonopodis pv. citri (strain 306) TaxID=190486 RepID=A0AAI7ZIM6_XANAC|nr:hypothetical protein XAC4027 [Xanthomonas citri pv. citri str. 306]AGI06099.1 Hypothetical Protein XCAW_00273 [Xanthomonas citri subsp. citri Aw12879]APR09401.1 hypothetical protein BI314_03545 [Xanthomonas citri pv. citri]QYF46951.1 hypothetical protein HZS93_04322 [Xanthomonas citri]APR15354.1 hypothetical protein BI315_11355 [Xanthomonas citri pv. citri]